MNTAEPSSIPPSQQSDPVNVADSGTTSRKPAPQSKRSNGHASKERFSKQDIECIVSWLEHPPNFSSVFGTSGQTSIGQPNKSATQGYAELAKIVNKQSKGRLNLNAKAVRERLSRFRRTYVAVKEKSKATGFGVTDEDRKNGIYTVAQKLESMCTCFARLDALFGHRPNVTPLSSFTGGLTLLEESQEASTASQRQRLLLEEDEEYEEEGENEDAEEDADEDADGGEGEGERNQEEVEVVPDSSQIIGDRDNGDITNNNAELFNGDDDISDVEGQETGFDLDNNTVEEEISELSISTQPSFQQQRQKRQLADQPQQQNKRPRPSGRRQKPPSLLSSSPESSRRSVWSSYEQAATLQDIEQKKLELERKRLELEEAKEAKRQEREDAREAKRQEREDAREAKRLEREDAWETKRLELEQRKLDQESKRRTTLLIQSGVEKGWSIDQIRAMLDLANKYSV
ncbi:hypothetical protein BGW41_006947 [Actinomortierella wolfii]|nr:hypothetical protein BGW41_006947 [Actinomortierella wolfii]